MIPVEKPGTPSELVHYGKKGMKWGVTTSSRRFATKNPTNKARSREIYRARARQQKRFVDYTTAPNRAERKKLKAAYLKHPDRATALRLSRGEKFAFTALGIAAPPVGVGLAIGGTARVVARRRIEKQQRRKDYK